MKLPVSLISEQPANEMTSLFEVRASPNILRNDTTITLITTFKVPFDESRIVRELHELKSRDRAVLKWEKFTSLSSDERATTGKGWLTT